MKPLLIIDAGHGGKDPGGGSNQHWLEKDLVLKISLYQYERFKALGVPVALTRDSDVYLSPSERTSIVKSSGAKYCISNHINAGGGDGVETIHSIYAEADLAKLLAQEIVNEGQNMRRVFTRTLPYNSKRDYYYLHRDTGAVDTTIVEYGFADSKQDDVAQLLNDWQDYAEAVVRAFCRHIGHTYKPVETEPAQITYEQELAEAVAWAKAMGISNGERLDEACTRAQVVTMLYRALSNNK
ncbi:N-acetylmuramoyl-L-alanine amidase [Bacillus sp. SM2101]|uniref:N-acetylmuramoyl-L-alanine amidase family protein n=1 Tax=Bacillus sp. SM2101 TaxID=2805366 RepID=UPI001BDE7DD0|nr:N-acetylmuramoyl-L-alanine amidase [Bacillus sp. SM2101]